MTGLCSTQGGGAEQRYQCATTSKSKWVANKFTSIQVLVVIGPCYRGPLPKNKINITAAAKAMTSSLLVVSLMEVVSWREVTGQCPDRIL